MRQDVVFTAEAERHILKAFKFRDEQEPYIGRSIVLFNILYVERKDRFGKTVATRGPHVYVGLEGNEERFDVCELPISKKLVYLSGFEQTDNLTIYLVQNCERGSFELRSRHDYGDLSPVSSVSGV